ncbi:DHBP synthase RibB-like alpha/beta domain-containing protein [Catenaria anguillulae PL171]|uniref:Threonylcarbamoyl-AMP synthase n=1 Tax=Catenaria anguillulae PL171 TaxID=765915 RepID=A0A1Y2H3T5_9FUNG|nr:DHBP synthase RibB-like alpha/beta domain-containing protein [Catenaria anguillulae PL171]
MIRRKYSTVQPAMHAVHSHCLSRLKSITHGPSALITPLTRSCSSRSPCLQTNRFHFRPLHRPDLPPHFRMPPQYATALLHADPTAIQFIPPLAQKSSLDPVPSQRTALEALEATPQVSDEETRDTLRKAAYALAHDEDVVAIPTETVYGLAGNALSASAVAKIFAAKQRPSDNPLIVHVSSLAMLRSLLPNQAIPDHYLPLIERFWPGPLTLLFPVAETTLPPTVTAGQPTVAVRMPAHPVARALIAIAGVPLAAPSANSSGKPSPTLAGHVMEDLNGRIPIVIDAGQCDFGMESTVVSLSPHPIILRPGGVTLEQLRKVPGLEAISAHSGSVDASATPMAPGMKYRHYSPSVPVHLLEQPTAELILETMKRLGAHPQGIDSSTPFKIGWFRACPLESLDHHPEIATMIELGSVVVFDGRRDPCRELFRGLRSLDNDKVNVIVVDGVPDRDLGRAFMNRAKKAASTVIPPRS